MSTRSPIQKDSRKTRWVALESQAQAAETLARQAGLSSLLARVLANRGMTDPLLVEGFLHPKLQRLSDPFLLPDMKAGVDRLFKALESQELVVVFGDYDVDGVTSTALLTVALRQMGWKVASYLPNRFDEGYGLSREAVANCRERFSTRLLLAVDCGSTSYEVIGELQGHGVDVVVLDHHQVSNPAPPAVALINPQRVAESDFAHLCSVGVAFKLVHALLKEGRARAWAPAESFDIRELLDLVGLGTIADMVPLVGENRILASAGLRRLSESKRAGIQALTEVAQCSGERLGTYEVGFLLGPRLNASGRLDTAEESLRLLTTADAAEARNLAEGLDQQNRSRQQIEKLITAEVLESVRKEHDPERDWVIVAGAEGWHVGVVGIVASRVLGEFYRPTIILGGDQGNWRGSGRSIEGFDMAEALRGCADLLERHGGHSMAAGVTVKPQNLLEFKRRLNEQARQRLNGESLLQPVRIDSEVLLSELTLENVKDLEQLQPTGIGNPSVQFMARDLSVVGEARQIGDQGKHLKFKVGRAGGSPNETVEAIWWGAGARQLPGRFDLVFAPSLNEFRGEVRVQLKVVDVRQTDQR